MSGDAQQSPAMEQSSPPTQPTFFQFEADFVESLRCIPMGVRCKLDTCGIKLKLDQWHQFSVEEREQLVTLPCNSPAEIETYYQWLKDLIYQHTQTQASELPTEEHPAWLNATHIPDSLQAKAQAIGITINQPQWQALDPLQRFALIKLSRPSHESKNFLPALKEFNLT